MTSGSPRRHEESLVEFFKDLKRRAKSDPKLGVDVLHHIASPRKAYVIYCRKRGWAYANIGKKKNIHQPLPGRKNEPYAAMKFFNEFWKKQHSSLVTFKGWQQLQVKAAQHNALVQGFQRPYRFQPACSGNWWAMNGGRLGQHYPQSVGMATGLPQVGFACNPWVLRCNNTGVVTTATDGHTDGGAAPRANALHMAFKSDARTNQPRDNEQAVNRNHHVDLTKATNAVAADEGEGATATASGGTPSDAARDTASGHPGVVNTATAHDETPQTHRNGTSTNLDLLIACLAAHDPCAGVGTGAAIDNRHSNNAHVTPNNPTSWRWTVPPFDRSKWTHHEQEYLDNVPEETLLEFDRPAVIDLPRKATKNSREYNPRFAIFRNPFQVNDQTRAKEEWFREFEVRGTRL